MSLIITETINSARGYGYNGKSSGPSGSVVFPAGTSSWTAPAGITKLLTVSGKGADGGSSGSFEPGSSAYAPCGSYYPSYPYDLVAEPSGYNPSYASESTTFADLYYEFKSYSDAWLAGVTATSPPGTKFQFSYPYYVTNFPGAGTNGAGLLAKAYGDFGGLFPNEVFGYTYYKAANVGVYRDSLLSPSNTMRLVDYTGGGFSINSYITNFYVFIDGQSGASTTAFSRTFPGGAAGSAATITNFSNVTVTPGTTYTIVNNGYLSITY
jgi:hypothetical protein